MTRKHFEKIAAILRATRSANDDENTIALLDLLAERFADEFATTNDRFDRDRFLAACR